MMVHTDNGPKAAIRLALLVGALIFSTHVWADPGETDPAECPDEPDAMSSEDGLSSFASGCGANANGDGSIAIGHNAETERMLRKITLNDPLESVGVIRIEGEGEEEDEIIYFVRIGDEFYEWENYDEFKNLPKDLNFIGFTIEDEDPDVMASDQALRPKIVDLITGAVEDPDVAFIVSANDQVDVPPDIEDTVIPVQNAVAVGPNAVVKGDGGIALGAGASVGEDDDGDHANGEESAGTNGIAIGNGAKVTGDNGIAIGAGVTAGENEIVIGTAGHKATIAGVDINKARADIDMNAADIMANADRINANASGIAGNAAAIADFDERLMGVDERVKQVAAMSAALSAVPNTVSGDGDFFVGVGFGNHDGEQGLAVGVSARFGPKKNIVFNAGAASAGDQTSVRAGVGFVW